MQVSVRHQLWILAVGAVAFFLNLGATRLWDQDEAYFARTAVEMHERNDWVVPYFNGEPFAHKPPLMFWMMRAGFMVFGVNEFAARFGSAVFGIATALLTYRVGRRMFNERVGLWAGLAMCTALMFDVVGRAATPDSFLVFFCTLALYLFVRRENWNATSAVEDDIFKRLSWSQWFAIYLVMGVAVLTKGPIGLVLPGLILTTYLTVRSLSGNRALVEGILAFVRLMLPWPISRYFDKIVSRHTAMPKIIWNMRPFTAIAAVLLIAGPWFVLVDSRTDGQFLKEFFGVHNYGRFVNPMDNHSGQLWYYVPAILAGFFPWSIFGIPATLNLIRCCRRSEGADAVNSRGAQFIACWIVVYVGFFSLAGTKLPSYVLPAYPAIALATALFIHKWLQQPANVNRWWPRLSFGSLAAVGLVLAIAGPMLANHLAAETTVKPVAAPELSDEMMLVAWLGALLLIGGGICLVLAEMQRRREATVGLAITAVAFCTALFAGVAVQIDCHQPSPSVAEVIHRHAHQSPRVAQFAYFRPSLVYYAGTRVEACKNPEQVSAFLKSSPDAFLVTTEEHYAKLYATLPVEAVVLERCPEFPKKGTVVVLGTKSAVASREKKLQQK